MRISIVAILITLITVPIMLSAQPAIGGAPKGDAETVAARIIKYNWPTCVRVSNASRRSDGSIRAKCDGITYLVFTLFDAEAGEMLEVAMNCKAAKDLLNVSC